MPAVWPAAARIVDGTPAVRAHSRGVVGRAGLAVFDRAPGARLEYDLTIAPMRSDDALAFRALLHSLRGNGVVNVPAPTRPGFRSAPLTASAARGAETLAVSTSAPFAAGDLVQLATATGAVTAHTDATLFTDATGYTDDPPAVGASIQTVRVVAAASNTLTIRPRLRASAPSGTFVVGHGVVVPMRLAPGRVPSVPLVNGRSMPVTLSLQEAY
jgi:hypothetical protein